MLPEVATEYTLLGFGLEIERVDELSEHIVFGAERVASFFINSKSVVVHWLNSCLLS